MTPEPWRRWLENPAVSRDSAESAPSRRRGLRARPDTGAGRGRRETRGSRRGLVLAIAIAAAAGGGAITALAGGGTSTTGSTGRPYAVITSTFPAPAAVLSTSSGPPPFCSPTRIGATTVTNAAGDRSSGPGVIAAYEHRFFVARDPRAALDVTDRGTGVPAETQLAQGIADIPVGAPWCVAITPLGGEVYETTVRYLPALGAQPVVWLLHLTVTNIGGVYTITNIEDQAS